MPVEFLPKDDRTLQGHQGPHFQAPVVGSGNGEADDEGGFHRGVQIMFRDGRYSYDDCYSPDRLWSS